MCYSTISGNIDNLSTVSIDFEVGDFVRIRGSHSEGVVTDCVLDRGRVWYGVRVDGVEQTVGQEQLEHAELEPDTSVVAESTTPTCRRHSWVLYTGMTDAYRYCKHCGIKESDSRVQMALEVFLSDTLGEWDWEGGFTD